MKWFRLWKKRKIMEAHLYHITSDRVYPDCPECQYEMSIGIVPK